VSTDEVWFGDLRIEPLEDGCRLTTVAGRAFLARGADPRSALKTLNIGTTDRKEAAAWLEKNNADAGKRCATSKGRDDVEMP